MITNHQPIRVAALALTVAASVSAQGPEKHSKSTLVSVPHGLSVDPSTTSFAGDASKVLVKRIGYYDDGPAPSAGGKPTEYPAPPPASGMVDYSTAAILQFIASPPDIDAFSIGIDWILSDGDGVEVVPPGHWGGLTFSVTRDSDGEAGSVIREEAMDVHKAGGDLFFHIFEDSDLIPANMLGETFLAQDATEMDIVPTSPAAGPDPVLEPEIDAHDLYIAALYREAPSLIPLLPPELSTPVAFFSVTEATKLLVPDPWWGGTTKTGGTIFGTIWDPGSETWSTPAPFLTYAELGLSALEEVDAIAVDLVRCELLFSTKTPARDEILWLPLGCTDGPAPMPKTYRNTSGTPISEKAKLTGSDDLDGICALDPGGSDLMRSLISTPAIELPWIIPPESYASVWRQDDITGTFFVSTAVGWPQPGRQPGVAGCMIVFPQQSPFIPLTGLLNRDVFSVWLGDPQEALFQVPPVHPLQGFDLGFQWLLLDQFTLTFEVPFTAVIRL